jgi:glycosyltransferase involved in cell wall biosynthesis
MSNPNIVYYGDTPVGPTGFGRVSEGIIGNLVNDFNFEVYGINHQPHLKRSEEFEDVHIHKASEGQDPYGRDGFVHYLSNTSFDFDIVFMLQDSFILSSASQDDSQDDPTYFIEEVRRICEQRDAKLVTYFPIDAKPYSSWVEPILEFSHQSVTYTNWAKETVDEVVGEETDLDVIYHGTSPDTFYPLDDDTVSQYREKYLDDPDGFYIGYVGTNQRRKNIPRDVIKAFAELRKQNDNAYLLLKTEHSNLGSGWHLDRVVERVKREEDIHPSSIQFMNPPGQENVDLEHLNVFYNMFDCVYLPSMEGWGLPITEAYTTKTPTIVGDHAGLSEVGAMGRSMKVDVPDHPNFEMVLNQDNDVTRTMIDINDFVETAEMIIHDSGHRQRVVNNAWDWAMNYRWSTIAHEEWKPVFKEMV